MKNYISAFLIISIFMGMASANTNLADVVKNNSPGIIILQNATYELNEPVTIPSNTVLVGSGETVIKGNYASFANKGAGMLIFEGVSNSGIRNLIIDGGLRGSDQYRKSGHDYENAILVGGGSYDLVFSNVTFLGLAGDGIRGKTSGSRNVTVKNCRFDKVGHDGVQNWNGNSWEITGNYFNLYINSGVRIASAKNCLIENNYFTSNTGSGFCGVELENNVEGTQILYNKFIDIRSHKSMGIATVHATGTVNIFGNEFSGNNGGNIVASGITITNNNVSRGDYTKIDIKSKPQTEVCNEENETKLRDENMTQINYEMLREKNLEIWNDLFRIATNETQRNSEMIEIIIESNTATLTKLYALEPSDENTKYVNELVNDTAIRDQMAWKLMNMSIRQHDTMRELVLKKHNPGV